jgi:hypothetical protein
MVQICQADFVALAGGVAELQRVADPVERIRRLGHAYIWFGVTHPNHYRLMFMTRFDLPPDVVMRDANKGNVDRDSYALLRQTCQEVIDEGRVRPEYRDADVLAQVFWSAVHGVTSLHIVKGDNPWIDWKGIERLAEAVIDSVVLGATGEPEISDLKSQISNVKSQISDLKSDISDFKSRVRNSGRAS